MGSLFYKGDQNVLWDALPYGYALYNSGIHPTYFIVDEKLGTADYRIKDENHDFMITSDYCNNLTGAVWIHQDISSGPFYTPAVEPKTWKKLGVHLKYIDEKYLKVVEEFNLKKILSDLGIQIENGDIIKALTESTCYTGIVPTRFSQRSISSVPLNNELKEKYWLLFLYALKGSLKASPKDNRKEILKRGRQLLSLSQEFLKDSDNKTVSDLQEFFWKVGWKVLFEIDAPKTIRVSELFELKKQEIPQKVFLIALSHPKEFAESYNEALNQAKLPLKRIRYSNNEIEFPFFMECKLECGTLVRWRIRAIFGDDNITFRLIYPIKGYSKEITLPKNATLEEVKKAFLSICKNPTLIGKAGPLVTELTRPPRILALPELGSKYTPMVFHLTNELKKRGIEFDSGSILRLGARSLASLKILGNSEVILPKFLSCFWGEKTSAEWISINWENEAKKASEILENMVYHPGQLRTLARYTLLEYNKNLPESLPKKLQKLGNVSGISQVLNKVTADKLESLVTRRDELLKKRREQRESFEELPEIYEVNRAIELIMMGIIKRHIQLSQLTYMNRRPYSLSFYLTWGAEIVKHMARNVEQRREKC